MFLPPPLSFSLCFSPSVICFSLFCISSYHWSIQQTDVYQINPPPPCFQSQKTSWWSIVLATSSRGQQPRLAWRTTTNVTMTLAASAAWWLSAVFRTVLTLSHLKTGGISKSDPWSTCHATASMASSPMWMKGEKSVDFFFWSLCVICLFIHTFRHFLVDFLSSYFFFLNMLRCFCF